MRKIRKIILHCSAGNPSTKARQIVAYHLRSKAEGGSGWKAPGYHYIIEEDGTVVATHPEDKVSNGVAGHNSDSIHVCYTGGVDITNPKLPPKDTRTPAQRLSMRRLVGELQKRYPDAGLHGHYEFANKACPSFRVPDEL